VGVLTYQNTVGVLTYQNTVGVLTYQNTVGVLTYQNTFQLPLTTAEFLSRAGVLSYDKLT
jgi:hypothetical protein